MCRRHVLHVCCRFVACMLSFISVLPLCCLHVSHVYIFVSLYMMFVIHMILGLISNVYQDSSITQAFFEAQI